MNKYDYVTMTIEEEKKRLEKIIPYLELENNESELLLYRDRYNNIVKYLTAKDEYNKVLASIRSDEEKLNKNYITKEEYEVDNILLEDTLLSKFCEDTNNKYKDLPYEDIKKEPEGIRNILKLLFEKETEYFKVVDKRNKLKELLNKDMFPRTYDTLISQDVIIEKEDSILDEIFILKNNIKIEKKKLEDIRNSVMTESILKILYEFCIIDSYDISKVNKKDVFNSNKNLVIVKDEMDSLNITKEENSNKKEEEKEKSDIDEKVNSIIDSLNFPGIDEDNRIDIDGKNYIK